MPAVTGENLPVEFLADLEKRFFWWEPGTSRPRSAERVIAQAMNFASFEDVKRLERIIGAERLANTMRHAAPGWISERSWEFWRGRLRLAGHTLSETPPRRSF